MLLGFCTQQTIGCSKQTTETLQKGVVDFEQVIV